MTIPETAAALGVSEPTVGRDWRVARAWLYKELKRELDLPETAQSGPSSRSRPTDVPDARDD